MYGKQVIFLSLVFSVLLVSACSAVRRPTAQVNIPTLTVSPTAYQLVTLPPGWPTPTLYFSPGPTPTSTLTPPPRTGPTPFPLAIPKGAVVLENEGDLCFAIHNDSSDLEGSFQPAGCFSSNCTLPMSMSIQTQVDMDRFVLRFFTRFVLVNPHSNDKQPYQCTADCGGGGSIHFYIGDVKPGTYAIWVGDKEIGQLSLPFQYYGPSPSCFSTSTYSTPVPTLLPTLTPTEPYPVPAIPSNTPYPAPVTS